MGYFIEISVATGEFAQNVSDLSSSDIGKQLVQSLNGLADVERTSQDIQSVQSEQDIATLMATGELFPGPHLWRYLPSIDSGRICSFD